MSTFEYATSYPRWSQWQRIPGYTVPESMTVTARYTLAAGATNTYTESIPTGDFKVNLTQSTLKSIYPGSVAFTMAGHTYWDYEGILYRDGNYTVADATESGSIDYQSGIVTFTDWVAGSPVIDILSMLVENDPWLASSFTTYTAVAPIQSSSLTIAVTAIDGELLSGTSAANGDISGDRMRGHVDVETGIIDLEFGEIVADADLSDFEKSMDWYDVANVVGGEIWHPSSVWPATGRYNCVAYVYLPLSAEVLGIDPIRLPMDGRVPLYRVGDVIVIHHTQETEVLAPLVNAQEIDLGRVRLAWAKVYNANETLVSTDDYTVNLDAGTVILDDVSSMIAPLNIVDRIEDMALVNDLQINGTLGITKALSHDYPLGTYVSSALITSDLFARVTNIFEQATWTGVWSNELIGEAPLAAYNNTVYPITITNNGGTQERWMIKFTSSTTFEVYGENSGLVATGDVNTICAPLNPATNQPYFSITALGWGSGWNTGNMLRFNTIAANKPIWVARTVLQSDVYSGTDQFCIEIRGDVDAP